MEAVYAQIDDKLFYRVVLLFAIREQKKIVEN